MLVRASGARRPEGSRRQAAAKRTVSDHEAADQAAPPVRPGATEKPNVTREGYSANHRRYRLRASWRPAWPRAFGAGAHVPGSSSSHLRPLGYHTGDLESGPARRPTCPHRLSSEPREGGRHRLVPTRGYTSGQKTEIDDAIVERRRIPVSGASWGPRESELVIGMGASIERGAPKNRWAAFRRACVRPGPPVTRQRRRLFACGAAPAWPQCTTSRWRRPVHRGSDGSAASRARRAARMRDPGSQPPWPDLHARSRTLPGHSVLPRSVCVVAGRCCGPRSSGVVAAGYIGSIGWVS